MQVRDFLEEALYLSLKDRYHNALPSDPTDKDAVLEPFIKKLNKLLEEIGKKNPAYGFHSYDTSNLMKDAKLEVDYIEPKNGGFLTIFKVEFSYSGGIVYPLERTGLNNFFTNAALRTVHTLPYLYNHNVFSNRLYIYPTPSVSGKINVFGKQSVGKFTESLAGLDENFPESVSDSFLLYAQHYVARSICSSFNVPWQAQKEKELQEHKRALSSENNINYQETSDINSLSVPIRSTRRGL